MPIVLAINGVVETYPIKASIPRHGRVDSVETQGDEGQHQSSSDRSLLAAQSAYQQAEQSHRPKPALLAGDLMTSPVVSLPSDGIVLEAWTVMNQKGFRQVPITTMHGTLVGIVSTQDLLHHVPELVILSNVSGAAHRRLAEIMTPRVLSATPTTDIRDIARAMLDEHIHAVPILDGNRRIVGILSVRDLLRGIAKHSPVELWT